MTRLPIFKPKELLAILLKLGFVIKRIRGSHFTLEHPITKRITQVAMHAKDLSRNMAKEILRQAGLEIKDILRILKKTH
ncbi:MAG: type II toxin-antitoxin system HicA family toxin [Patescibacteria group bacterium]